MNFESENSHKIFIKNNNSINYYKIKITIPAAYNIREISKSYSRSHAFVIKMRIDINTLYRNVFIIIMYSNSSNNVHYCVNSMTPIVLQLILLGTYKPMDL